MKKNAFIKKLKEETGNKYTQAALSEMLNNFSQVLYDVVSKGDDVRVGSFRFKLKICPPRMGVNPQTHEKMEIPEKKYIVCKKLI